MEQKIQNKLDDVDIGHDYVAGNQTNNYISLYREEEREFVVTHHATIKPVYYFTGRETELNDLRQKIESRQKSVLVSGKTHICRKLFEEYKTMGRSGSFRYIGYIEYNGDLGSSLQECLRYKEQERPEENQEAAWKELEYLASDGKLLLFIDNVNKTIKEDPGLRRLNSIPGAIILTSRRTSFGKEFEPYRIGFLCREQCKEIYEKIRFENSGKKVAAEETSDLEYIIEKLAARHTITVEFLAHLAREKHYSTGKLRRELEEKGFQLEYRDDQDELVNIQKSYETLYDMSGLTEAEQNILEAFSMFPYIPLEVEICNQWLLADAGASEEDDILMQLYQRGWLQFDMENESYALHPVFAQFIYEKCKPKMEKHIGLIEACEEILPEPYEPSLKYWKFIPFIISLFEKMDFRKRIVHSRLTDRIALWFRNAEMYEEAEKWNKKFYDIFKEIKGKYHPITLRSYINLAINHVDLGNYKGAEKEFKEILKSWKCVPIKKKDYVAIASTYKCLENLYMNQGRYDEAEMLCEKILSIEKHLQRKDQFGLAEEYHAYAQRYDAIGKYEKAEKFYERCCKIRKTLTEVSDLTIMLGYYELGEVYMKHGKYQNAQKCFVKMKKIGSHKYKIHFLDVDEIMKRIFVKEKLIGNFYQWLEQKKSKTNSKSKYLQKRSEKRSISGSRKRRHI